MPGMKRTERAASAQSLSGGSLTCGFRGSPPRGIGSRVVSAAGRSAATVPTMTRGLMLALVGLALMASAVVLGVLPDTVSLTQALAASVGTGGVVLVVAGSRYRDE